MALPRHTLTLDEFLRRPEEKPPLEYIDGKISQKVAPKPVHSGLEAFLVMYFNSLGMPRKIARCLPGLRTTYAGQSRVPDITVFTWARVPINERGRLGEECLYPPDIAIEIISPGQTIRHLSARCRWYVANGVRLAVLVLPRRESAMIFEPGQEPRELRGDDTIDFRVVIPGARLSVRELFSALDHA